MTRCRLHSRGPSGEKSAAEPRLGLEGEHQVQHHPRRRKTPLVRPRPSSCSMSSPPRSLTAPSPPVSEPRGQLSQGQGDLHTYPISSIKQPPDDRDLGSITSAFLRPDTVPDITKMLLTYAPSEVSRPLLSLPSSSSSSSRPHPQASEVTRPLLRGIRGGTAFSSAVPKGGLPAAPELPCVPTTPPSPVGSRKGPQNLIPPSFSLVHLPLRVFYDSISTEAVKFPEYAKQ